MYVYEQEAFNWYLLCQASVGKYEFVCSLEKNIQSDTYEWTLDKLNVNRQWSVLIGKYEIVCYAEKHTNYYLRIDIR